jgi:hypothetical protein
MRRSLTTLFLVLFLVSCSKVERYNKEGDIRPIFKIPDAWIMDTGISSLIQEISPDGKWIASIDQTENRITVVVNSITTGEQFTSDFIISEYTSIISWSPDSKSFVISASSKRTVCPYDRIYIFTLINNGPQFTNIELNPSPQSNETGCVELSWAPNSRKFIMMIKNYEALIVNIEGVIEERRDLAIEDFEQFGGFYWTKYNILYTIYDVSTPPVWQYELRSMNEIGPATDQTIYTNDEGIFIVGENDYQSNILVNLSDSYNNNQIKLATLSLKTGKTINIFQNDGYITNSTSSKNSRYIAFVIANSGNDERNLYIFDWVNNNVFKQGSVVDLLHWDEEYGGFQIIQGSDKEGFSVSTISPP